MRGGARLVYSMVALVGVLVSGFGGIVHADGNWADGYCTPDGKPVVTYWPPGWKEADWEVTCKNGTLWFTGTDPSNPDILDTTPREQPPDFGRWADILFNGRWMTNPYNDVDPFVVKSTGRTLIPIRYVSEALGAEVDWNSLTRTATITWRERSIVVTIGETEAQVNGQEFTLDQPPIIWKDRTLVPLRFVAEAFGAKVEWNEASSEAVISLPGVECAPSYCRK